MGRLTDTPGLDESRPAPGYGDTVGETVIHRLMHGRPMIDWKIIGPRTVRQNAHLVHTEGEGREWLPDVTNKPLQLSLMPEVAVAVLRFLDTISEPLPSRSGHSLTFRLKKNAAAILPDHDGNPSPGNRKETKG